MLLLPNEPYHGDDAMCAECGKPIKLSECGHTFDGVLEAPDGLPAPVLVAVCRDCESANLSDSTRTD